MVDAPGCFDLDVLVMVEHGGESVGLFVGEQISTGQQSPAGLTERVPGRPRWPRVAC